MSISVRLRAIRIAAAPASSAPGIANFRPGHNRRNGNQYRQQTSPLNHIGNYSEIKHTPLLSSCPSSVIIMQATAFAGAPVSSKRVAVQSSRRGSHVVRAAVAVPQQFSAVKPVGDRVLVKVDKEEGKSVGGVLLPTVAQTKQTAGAIVAAGDVNLVKAGDRVVYSRYAGTDVELAGEEHVLIKEEDVIGILPAGDKIGNLKPMGDRVLIKCAESAKQTAGGVLLASDSGDKPNFGTVVAVGEGKKNEDGTQTKPNVSVGATVMYSKYSGTEYEDGDDQFIVVRESDILAQLA